MGAARHMLGGAPNSRDLRLYTVQHAGQHRARRLPDDAKDRKRDEQADDRVGKRKTQPDAKCSEYHGKSGQAVGAGVVAVGNECCAVHFPADPDAKHRNRLIAEKADNAGRRKPAEMRHHAVG